jgi:glutathione peroxidase
MKVLLTVIAILTLMMPLTSDDANNFHHFKVKDIRGNEVSLDQFKGQVVMVVNTASKCGFTPQYAELQSLFDSYKDQGLVVLGFPSGDFAGQELDSDEAIAEFCQVNYGVTFPMFSKTVVRGENQHELFQFLTSTDNIDFTGDINWNFEKFLIDKEGELVRRFRSRTNPKSDEILQTLETLLNQ